MNKTMMWHYPSVTRNKTTATAVLFSNMVAHNNFLITASRWWELVHSAYLNPGGGWLNQTTV